MYRRIAAIAAAGLMLAGQSAVAAEGARLNGVTGSVLVSQNGRFVPASNGALLRAGDRVVASSGSARVVYGDGCNVAVSARSMTTVATTSPCAGGSSGLVQARFDEQDGSKGYTVKPLGGYDRPIADIFARPDFMTFTAFSLFTLGMTVNALNQNSTPTTP